MEFLVGLQEWIRASVSAELDAFEATRSVTLLVAMLPLGIALGAIHALTPGHGKTVLASYVVGSGQGLARSVGVAGVLSATHVASAVILALVSSSLLSRTIAGAGRSDLIEDVSRGLIALIGLWLLVRAIRGARHVHGVGGAVGFVAGLVPCPLTLFAMVLAISRGIPEAGIAFAVSMLIGIALTLSVVAAATVLARDRVAIFMERHGAPMARVARALDAIGGALLIAIGITLR
jgi:nickel/cobalt exporter